MIRGYSPPEAGVARIWEELVRAGASGPAAGQMERRIMREAVLTSASVRWTDSSVVRAKALANVGAVKCLLGL